MRRATVEINQFMQEISVIFIASSNWRYVYTFEATTAFVINALAGRLFLILE